MFHNSFSKEIFPNILFTSPLMQLEATSSHPITSYLGEETNTGCRSWHRRLWHSHAGCGSEQPEWSWHVLACACQHGPFLQSLMEGATDTL